MDRLFRRGSVLALTLAGVVVGAAGTASAHGVHATDSTVTGFLIAGFTHMLTGWDHLLFIAGVLLLARQVKPAVTLISLFAVGHSATLIAATMVGWRVSATTVDVVIALSVVFVGAVGIVSGQLEGYRWFGVAVLGFGLAHGIGLSTGLQDLGLPQDGALALVISFNVGVELGQLVAIAVVFTVVALLRHRITWQAAPRFAYLTLVTAGVIASAVLITTAPDANDPAQAQGECQTRQRTQAYRGSSGHPPKDFYEPGQTAPEAALGHVIGDGYVIVHYRPTALSQTQMRRLREFVTNPRSGRVVAGPAPAQQPAVKAVNAYRTLVCESFKLSVVETFTAGWFNDPRSQPVE